MALSICCKDVGADCDFVVEGRNEKELFENALAHAKEAHGVTEIPDDIKRKMRRLICEEKAA